MNRIVSSRTGPATDGRPSHNPVSLYSLLFSLILGLLTAGWAGAFPHLPPGEHRPGETGDALVLLAIDNIDMLWEFVGEWEKEGARFPHVYPPNLLIGDVPASIEMDLLGDFRVAEIHRKDGAGKVRSERASAWKTVFDSWKGERPPGGESAAAPSFKHDEPFDDLLLPPPYDPELAAPAKTTGGLVRRYGEAYGATMLQTSEMIIGRNAVSVIMPDAPGGAYSESEYAVVVREARAAMDFWASKVPSPGARFVYDIRKGVPTTRNFHQLAPTHNNDDWVREIMEAMGYDLFLKGTDYGPVYEYLDSLRIRTRSEWGVVFFIPKIIRFVNAGYTAYAYLGGPFFVVPSGHIKVQDNVASIPRGNGSTRLSHIIIHESGHLYWALDEYEPGAGTSQPCHVRSGYLGIMNKNSSWRDYWCDPRQVGCTMDEPGPWVCKYTLGQMGWWDSAELPDYPEGDGIPDILDTHPYVYADTLPDTITTVFPMIRGIAAVMPLVNRAGGAVERSNITFNTIRHVIYRIDDMVDEEETPVWFYGDPEGGWGGDSTRVHFAFEPVALTGGEHTIRIKAVNTMGNLSTWGENRQTVFVKAIALDDFLAEPDYDGRVRISYSIRGGTFGAAADLYRVSPDGAKELVRSFTLEDSSEVVLFDDMPKPGENYVYRLEASALGESWNWNAPVISPAPIARGEHISRITPNPFRGTTMISILVPRGNPAERRAGGGSGKPGEAHGGATYPTGGSPQFTSDVSSRYKIIRVEVDIYNVAGRLIRHFPPVHSYEGFHADPFIWDGDDSAGRAVAQGIYFVRMRAGDDVWETRKVMLLR